MLKLLNINNVNLPDTDGKITIAKNDKFNEYEGEDGTKTIETIRTGMLSASVSFVGLIETNLHTIMAAISLVSTVKILNPATGTISTITAKISNVKTSKVWYKNDLSVWDLSFDIEQLQ